MYGECMRKEPEELHHDAAKHPFRAQWTEDHELSEWLQDEKDQSWSGRISFIHYFSDMSFLPSLTGQPVLPFCVTTMDVKGQPGIIEPIFVTKS